MGKMFELFTINNKLKIIEDVNDFRGGLVKELGANNYLVLKALTCYIDENNECYPSISTVADMLGFSTKTVMRSLKDLEEKGYIKKEQVKLKGVKQLHNKYTLLDIVEDASEDENKGTDADRLLAHFKNKYREKYFKDYVSEYYVNDMRDIERILDNCDNDFEYACKLVDKYIETYRGEGKYKTANIYFLYHYRITEIKKLLTKGANREKKELTGKEKVSQEKESKFAHFGEDNSDLFLKEDEEIVAIDVTEYNEFLVDKRRKQEECNNF